MGSCENAQAACGFATFNFVIHGALLGVITWYLGFQMETDLETATIDINVAGITVAVNKSVIEDLLVDGNDESSAIQLENDLGRVILAIQMVGIIPIGLGTFASLIMMVGFLGRNSCRCGLVTSGVVSAFTTIIYIILAIASAAILVVIYNEEFLAYIEELLNGVVDFNEILSGATREFDDILKTNTREDRQTINDLLSNVDQNVNLPDLLASSEFGSLIQSIDLATFDAAIPDVDLSSIIAGDTIDLSNTDQLDALADALQDVDLENSLQTYISNVLTDIDVGELLQGVLNPFSTMGAVGVAVYAVLSVLMIISTCFGCNAKKSKNRVG